MNGRIWNLSLQNISFLMNYLKSLDFNTQWEVVIREKKNKRTLEQNERLWKLYESVGNHLGYTKDEMHDVAGWKFLRYQVEIAGEVVNKIESTTKLNTARMSWYQEQIEIWASQMGWSW